MGLRETLSFNEEVLPDEKQRLFRATPEERFTPEVLEDREALSSISQTSLADKISEEQAPLREQRLQFRRTNDVLSEWGNFLSKAKAGDATNTQIEFARNDFMKTVRARDEYKDKTDEQFKDLVEIPTIDRMFQEKSFRPDAAVEGPTKIGFFLERFNPMSAVAQIQSILHEGVVELGQAPKKFLEERAEEIAEFRKLEKEMPMKEAFKKVRENLNRDLSELPLLSPEKILLSDIPTVVRTGLEFTGLRKAGTIVAGSKAAAKLGITKAIEALETSSPIITKAAKGALTFGTHSAGTDIGGWRDNPKYKALEVFKSSLFGAAVGILGAVTDNPLAKFGIIGTGMTVSTFVEAKFGGSDTKEAFTQSAESFKMLIAYELSGILQGKGQRIKADKQATTNLTKKHQLEHPGMSWKEARIHAKADRARIRQESVTTLSEKWLKPLLELDKKGQLYPKEKQELDRKQGLLRQIYQEAEKDKLTAEQVFAKSKFKSPEHKAIVAKVVSSANDASDARRKAIQVHKRAKELNLSDDDLRALYYDATGKFESGSPEILQGPMSVVPTGRISNMKVVIPGSTGPVHFGNLTNKQLDHVLGNINRVGSVQEISRKQTALGLTDKELRRVSIAGGHNLDTIGRVLDSASWPLFPDKTLRRMDLENLERNAITMRRHLSPLSKTQSAQDLQFMNPKAWTSTRYFMDWASRLSGKPINELAASTEQANKIGQHKATEATEVLVKEIGLSRSTLLGLNAKERAAGANYLFYASTDKGATLYNKLSPKLKKAVNGVKGFLDEGSMTATKVRGLAWYEMNTAFSRVEGELTREMNKPKPNKKTIARLKNQVLVTRPPDMKKEDVFRVIQEGRVAQREGKWYDYLHSKTWATQETYSMGEHEWDKFIDKITPPTLASYESKLANKQIDPGFLKSQKKGAQPNLDMNFFTRAVNHAQKVHTLFEMYPHYEKFRNTLQGADKLFHPQDRAVLNVYSDTLLGKKPKPGAIVRQAMRLNKFWWDGYMSQPSRFLYFGYRNPFQTVAMLPGQVSPVEFAKASVSIIMNGRSPQAMAAYKKDFKSVISQKMATWETMTMTDSSEMAHTRGANALRNLGKKTVAGSDEFNRWVAFWPIYQMSESNTKLFREGKISSEKLISRLNIRSLAPGQEQKWLNNLRNGDDAANNFYYTSQKVVNANYAYDRYARSVIQQDPTNQTLVGLINWTTGFVEGWDRNVVRPIYEGFKLGNWRRSYEGVKNMTEAAVGLYLAAEGMEHSLGTKGREEYGVTGILQTSPFSPGLNWIVDTVGLKDTAIEGIMSAFDFGEKVRRRGGTPASLHERILKKGFKQAQYFIPLGDVGPIVFSKLNNKKAMTWWDTFRDIGPGYNAEWDRKLPTFHQSTVEKFMTGVMNTERADHPIFQEVREIFD